MEEQQQQKITILQQECKRPSWLDNRQQSICPSGKWYIAASNSDRQMHWTMQLPCQNAE